MAIWKDRGTGSRHVTLIREVEMWAGEKVNEGGGWCLGGGGKIRSIVLL